MTAFDDVPRESTLKSEFDSKFERGAQTVDITGHIHSRPNFTYKLKILLGFFQIMVHTHTQNRTNTRIHGFTDTRTYGHTHIQTHTPHTHTHTPTQTNLAMSIDVPWPTYYVTFISIFNIANFDFLQWASVILLAR